MSKYQLKEAFEKTGRALQALKIAIDDPMQSNRLNVDGTIQRFEFSIELFWKLLKRILVEKGVEVVYPRDVLREAYAGFLIDDEKAWLNMLRDRNVTSHTYNQELADEIYNNLKSYYPILKKTYDKLKVDYLG